MSSKKTVAVIAAAGSGERMGGVSKPDIVIAGKTLFQYVLKAFGDSSVDEVVAVCSEDNLSSLRAQANGFNKPITFVRGGDTRAESVFRGVEAAGGDAYIICTHDCARPFVTASLIDRAVEAAELHGASCVCSPITDTVKMRNADGEIFTPDRNALFAVQTPQCFKKALYLEAKNKAGEVFSKFTDETSLLENHGFKVEYIINTENNLKLTSPFDIKLAEAIIEINL